MLDFEAFKLIQLSPLLRFELHSILRSMSIERKIECSVDTFFSMNSISYHAETQYSIIWHSAHTRKTNISKKPLRKPHEATMEFLARDFIISILSSI